MMGRAFYRDANGRGEYEDYISTLIEDLRRQGQLSRNMLSNGDPTLPVTEAHRWVADAIRLAVHALVEHRSALSFEQATPDSRRASS